MNVRIALLGLAFTCFSITACDDDTIDDPMIDPVTITAQDFSASIQENPTTGDTIGQIDVAIDPVGTTVSIVMTNVDPAGAIEFTGNGFITVADAGLFDFESITSVTAEYTASVDEVESTGAIAVTITDDVSDNETRVLWTGPALTFTRADGVDHTNTDNQDRLTDQVIITRGAAGQIFNIAVESEADKDESPVGTQWAFGSIADGVESLDFMRFRDLGKPKENENKAMVMRLVEENIFVDVTFLTWSEGNRGGFSYERSTPN